MFNFGFMLEGSGNGGGGGWIYIVMIALIVVMFIFMSRSQKKRDREAAEMRDSLQVGDEVTTIGGMIGKVVSIKGDTFVLETTKDKTKIRFLKGAIRSIDVKAADIAAAVLETKTVSKDEDAENDAPVAEVEAAPAEEAAVEADAPVAEEEKEENK